VEANEKSVGFACTFCHLRHLLKGYCYPHQSTSVVWCGLSGISHLSFLEHSQKTSRSEAERRSGSSEPGLDKPKGEKDDGKARSVGFAFTSIFCLFRQTEYVVGLSYGFRIFDHVPKSQCRTQLNSLLRLEAMNYRFARRLALRWAYGRKHQKNREKI